MILREKNIWKELRIGCYAEESSDNVITLVQERNARSLAVVLLLQGWK